MFSQATAFRDCKRHQKYHYKKQAYFLTDQAKKKKKRKNLSKYLKTQIPWNWIQITFVMLGLTPEPKNLAHFHATWLDSDSECASVLHCSQMGASSGVNTLTCANSCPLHYIQLPKSKCDKKASLFFRVIRFDIILNTKNTHGWLVASPEIFCQPTTSLCLIIFHKTAVQIANFRNTCTETNYDNPSINTSKINSHCTPSKSLIMFSFTNLWVL